MPREQVITISCNATRNFAQLRAEWSAAQQANISGVSGTNRCASTYDLGGGIFRFDSTSGTFIELPVGIQQPNGFARFEGLLAVASMATNQVHLITELLEHVGTLCNSAFNDLHSIVLTTRGYLLTSSGVDAIIEVDTQGNTLWEYWFSLEGYNQTPLGLSREIDPKADHTCHQYPTLQQTTHVNSAIVLKDEFNSERYILATLFHQGKLVRIDRETHACTVLLDGLRCPHAIRQYAGVFLLSDSNNNRVLILNSSFEIIKELKDNFSWVQDAIFIEDERTVVLVDANNSRLVFWNIDTDQKEYVEYDANWRVYQVENI